MLYSCNCWHAKCAQCCDIKNNIGQEHDRVQGVYMCMSGFIQDFLLGEETNFQKCIEHLYLLSQSAILKGGKSHVSTHV